jgi:hypothetical protein
MVLSPSRRISGRCERSDSAVERQFLHKFALRLRTLLAFGPPLSEEISCFLLATVLQMFFEGDGKVVQAGAIAARAEVVIGCIGWEGDRL